ncbi:MAG TPA: hypothetical protein VF575_02870 [Candidatus Saccharimonadales bacterium]
MAKGSRPGNEFVIVDKARSSRTAPAEIRGPWPELRIVRQAEPESRIAPDWHEYLDDVGRRNYGSGTARSLGSIAIVFIPAKAMNMMLEDKYPKLYASRAKTVDLQRKIASGLYDLMRSAQMTANAEQLRDMRIAHDMPRHDTHSQARSWQEIRYVPNQNQLRDQYGPDADTESITELQTQPVSVKSADLPFVAATYKVRGVGMYGPGYALDLSTNPDLYEERDAMVRHLRVSERVDTSRLEKDGWEPHATIFTPEEHFGNKGLPSALKYQVQLSPVMDFGAPKAILSKHQ